MLVLTRKIDDQIQIGPNITITVLRFKGRTVQIGIEAPETVEVLRGELAAAAEMQASGECPAPASPQPEGSGRLKQENPEQLAPRRPRAKRDKNSRNRRDLSPTERAGMEERGPRSDKTSQPMKSRP